MALDLQQRPPQHGHRRDHTRYEAETSRVILQADPIKNGGITATSTAQFPDYNIHYFIGAEMFGLANFGIPPSILGEIILYLGPIFVFPVTFLIALFLARLERLMVQTPLIFLKLFLLLLLANSYFLLLNSDILSLIKRTVFDSAFLFIAIISVNLAKSGVNQNSNKEKQAG